MCGLGRKQSPAFVMMPHVSVLSAFHWTCAAGDGMGWEGQRGSVLGVCPLMMSCVMLSILLYELLCISDPQSGLLSLPSIIQYLFRVSTRTHTYRLPHGKLVK